MCIKIGFSAFESNVLASENSHQYDYVGFKVDRKQGVIMILSKDIEEAHFKDRLYLKLLKLNNIEEVLLEMEIEDRDMKGIFLSGEFSLIDGHIYFNNTVIKLRYDLMKTYGQIAERQCLLFNKYSDILDLKKEELVKTTFPLDSPTSQRLTYVVISKNGNSKRIIIVPYLHERMIKFNRAKMNTEYFYTTTTKTEMKFGKK
jgi:hypothetical protein